MDVVEIRMWNGIGPAPAVLPIKMRGFVSAVNRGQAMTPDGKPSRTVVVSGHDYGKIWQTYQIAYLPAYAAGKPLLTSFALFELFKVDVKNTLPAPEFIRQMVEKIINPHLKGLMPKNSVMPTELKTGDSISVKRGVVNNSYQNQSGALYDMMRLYGDVGPWNELYTEDREDGVHVVYRPIPALRIAGINEPIDSPDRKIDETAPDPVFVPIEDSFIQNLQVARSDSNVANFYWVVNQRYDLIDDISRKLHAMKDSDKTLYLKDYPNSAVKYYGDRIMTAETMQSDDGVTSLASGLPAAEQERRSNKFEEWIDYRRRVLIDMNKDNVVFEQGSALVKGGPMRIDGTECMKAGDYALFRMGNMEYGAYAVQISDDFRPFVGYTTTLSLERGEGFVTRAQMEGGSQSPWLVENASGRGF